MAKVPAAITAEQYQLRATYFSNQVDKRNLTLLFGDFKKHALAIDNTLDWSDRIALGIEESIYSLFVSEKRSASFYFCHPQILITYPRALSYYRCLSSFPIKGLKAVSGVSSIDKMELGEANISKEQAFKISNAINSHLNLFYKAGAFSDEKMKALMYMTMGTTVDGSWRNQIGSEGERVIKNLILQFLFKKGYLKSLTSKDGGVFTKGSISEKFIDKAADDLSTATVSNGSSLIFASEPDITIRNNKSEIIAGVEIKAGLDPAGALERLGAMLKSFDKLLGEEPDAETLLIASCITEEVQARLNTAKSVSATMVLTDITLDVKGRQKIFLNRILYYLGLVKAYL